MTEVKELSLQEWKAEKSKKRAQFVQMQQLPYEVKVKRAEQRAIEFYEEMDKRGFECHVPVGGLDSITLFLFLKEIGIKIPGITVSSLEDKSIQKIHKQLDLTMIEHISQKLMF
jgi:hypothetical protein